MAVKNSSAGLKTGLNISFPRKNVSSATSTSARKFFAKDQVVNPPVENNDVKSNGEHLTDTVNGMRVMSNGIKNLADFAREQVDLVRKQVGAIIPAVSPSAPNSRVFSHHDIVLDRKRTVDAALRSVADDTSPQAQMFKDGFPDLLKHSLSRALPVRNSAGNQTSGNPGVPFVDHVAIDIDRKKGSVDAFFAEIKMSVLLDDITKGNVKALRIFRAEISGSNTIPPGTNLSLAGVELISSDASRARIKNQDDLSIIEKRLIESRIPNSVSGLSAVDPFTNVRRGSLLVTGTFYGNARGETSNVVDDNLSPYLKGDTFRKIDRSVSLDLNSLRNIQLQQPRLVRPLPPTDNVSPKNIASQNLGFSQALQLRFSDQNGLVIDQNNSQRFKEICFLSTVGTPDNVVGKYAEFFFDDLSVMYGHSYAYFFSTVDRNLNESVRSQIVQVTIDGFRIPNPPDSLSGYYVNNSVLLSILSSDLLVEKFEVYRKDNGSPVKSSDSTMATIVSDTSGFLVSTQDRQRQKNDFTEIGECLNGGKRGSTFYDRNCLPGHSYSYRIYSVDIFGNKSSDPKEFDLFIPDQKNKTVELTKPTILVENDVTTNKCKVTLHCADERVTALFLTRRDLTINQSAFVPPGQVNFLIFGRPVSFRGPRSFEDVHLFDQSKDTAWKGIFQNTQQDIIFVDNTTQIDHIYQYQVHGIDIFGNTTSYETSKKVFISRRPVLNTPLNLTGSLLKNGEGALVGINLRWEKGDLDITSEDLIGNQSVLADNSVRTLFQLERKRVGEENWYEFPLIESSSFTDLALLPNAQSPIYRPPLLQANQTYLYRVQTFLSGGFVSNFSPNFEITFEAAVTSPINFHAATGDPKVRPLYAFMSWDDGPGVAVIDHWEIERCAINNFAASRINPSNLSDALRLQFVPLRTVFREASRFNSISSDKMRSNSFFPGTHRFADADVSLGNTYFYRIRAVGLVQDNASGWVHAVVRFSDPLFEAKQHAVLTDQDKRKLASGFFPFTVIGQDNPKKSLSLVPEKK